VIAYRGDMENLTQRQQQFWTYRPGVLRQTVAADPSGISAHIGTSGTVTALHHIKGHRKKGYLRRRKAVPGYCPYRKSRKIEALVLFHRRTVRGTSPTAVERIEGYCAILLNG